jgi:hypothetical protein
VAVDAKHRGDKTLTTQIKPIVFAVGFAGFLTRKICNQESEWQITTKKM